VRSRAESAPKTNFHGTRRARCRRPECGHWREIPVALLLIFWSEQHVGLGRGRRHYLEDVKAHAQAGDLIEFLTEKADGSFGGGFLNTPSWQGFATWYVEQIAENCRAMSGRERRKYGIKNRGICLLISYTAEILQGATDEQLNVDRKMYSGPRG
jgi:hypothetical protein